MFCLRILEIGEEMDGQKGYYTTLLLRKLYYATLYYGTDYAYIRMLHECRTAHLYINTTTTCYYHTLSRRYIALLSPLTTNTTC